MKPTIITILLILLTLNLHAQNDTTEVKALKENVITIVEKGEVTQVKMGGDGVIEILTDEEGDTTHIRIGRRIFRVKEDSTGTNIVIEKEDRDKIRNSKFNPHWAGMEIGINMYNQSDYSIYQKINTVVPENFMDLNYGKSITINFNIAEWAFKNEAENFGIVTGLGFSIMDFTFDRPLTIEKQGGEGIVMPVELDPEGLKKSKLNISYITAPLLLEIKTPLRMGTSNLYVAGGIIGGLNIGSHTKYKYKNDKEKVHSNFNLTRIKYDLTGRIGFGDFCIFVNYGMTPLFKDDQGPELYPVTFGFSFPNI